MTKKKSKQIDTRTPISIEKIRKYRVTADISIRVTAYQYGDMNIKKMIENVNKWDARFILNICEDDWNDDEYHNGLGTVNHIVSVEPLKGRKNIAKCVVYETPEMADACLSKNARLSKKRK